jgi:UDP-3-O-acyl N-acetylglucosamine deacetylase
MLTTLHELPRHQRTLAKPVSVSGFGFWSGRDVNVEFRPAPANSGVVFVRRDLQPAVTIPAQLRYRIETPRRTALSRCGVQVEMVEHVLAALAGLEIDNCEIWTDAAEMPGLDGSSGPFVDALQSAGIVVQSAPRRYLVVREVTRVGDDESWIEARPSRNPAMSLQYRLDYGADHAIGRETMRITLTPSRFVRELAPARTFLTWDEAEWLRQQGLAKRVTAMDVLVFGEHGLIEGSLRLANECAAHKVLDMVGDLSLAGCDLIGQFVAHRSGHRLNAALVQALLTEFQIVDDWKATA